MDLNMNKSHLAPWFDYTEISEESYILCSILMFKEANTSAKKFKPSTYREFWISLIGEEAVTTIGNQLLAAISSAIDVIDVSNKVTLLNLVSGIEFWENKSRNEAFSNRCLELADKYEKLNGREKDFDTSI